MALPPKPKRIKSVYLDHAAATPLDPLVYAAMKPFFDEQFANSSALYASAVESKKALEQARNIVADTLEATPDTIVFTGSGTESCNLAILGAVRAAKKHIQRPHVITTTLEHHAVLAAMKQLETEGVDVTYLPVSTDGTVDPQECVRAITKQTVLVSVMYANNEIGTIQPLADIGKHIRAYRKQSNTTYPYFHSDACQASTQLTLRVEKLHTDLLSLNGSKLYGPKGVGALYIRRGIYIEPLLFGGKQEFGLRPGTENLAGIVGFATALHRSQDKREVYTKRVRNVQHYFLDMLFNEITGVILNGPVRDANRLANNINVSFHGVDAESLIFYLNAYGISCASGSACTTDTDTISHVLTACGVPAVQAKSTIRFSLGRSTTTKDIDYVMKYLPSIIQALRENY